MKFNQKKYNNFTLSTKDAILLRKENLTIYDEQSCQVYTFMVNNSTNINKMDI